MKKNLSDSELGALVFGKSCFRKSVFSKPVFVKPVFRRDSDPYFEEFGRIRLSQPDFFDSSYTSRVSFVKKVKK